jgi:hypothetical protein
MVLTLEDSHWRETSACDTCRQVRLSNLPPNTHWTELKDAMRKVGEVIYANVEGDTG